MTPIKGTNVVVGLQIVEDGPYYPVFCATDMSYDFEVEEIEVSTVTSGVDKEFRPRMRSSNISVTGVSKVDNTDGQICFLWLAANAASGTIYGVELSFTDDEGNVGYIYADVFIRSGNVTGPVSGFSTASVIFRVTGSSVFTDTPAPTPDGFTELSDYWQTVNGQNYISGASSGAADGTNYTLGADDTPLIVFMEGAQYNLTTGTPTVGLAECKFTSGTGRITFPTDVIFDGSQRVAVVWRRTT